MASWTQKTKASPSGSQKAAAKKAGKSSGGGHPSAGSKGGNDGKGGYTPPVAKKTRDGPSDAVLKARAAAADEKKLEAAEKKTKDRIAKETAESNVRTAERIRKKALAVSAKKAKNKRNQQAKARADQQAEAALVAKEKSRERSFKRDSTQRLPSSTGSGMQGAGVANYPTGKAKGLELPSSPLGMLGAALSPMGSMVKKAGKVFMNQSKYGMNDEAKIEYDRLIRDPANAGKSEQELVQLARKPQMDKQLPHAFIDGNPTTDVQKEIAKLTGGRAPMSTVYNNDGSVNLAATASNVSSDNQGTQGTQGVPTATEEEERIKLGQLPTGSPITDRPSWAPSLFEGIMPQQSWAPQWQQQAPLQSFAPQWGQPQQPMPQPQSMLNAPMQLRAPPSRFLKG